MRETSALMFILIAGFSFSTPTLAQQIIMQPTEVKQPVAFMTTIPMSEMEQIPATGKSDWKNGVVPNKDYMPANRGKSRRELRNIIPDYALQKQYSLPASGTDGLVQNFDGIANTYGVAPPDTDGDVGLNHYIQMVNMGYQVFTKTGTALIPPTSLSTLWTNLPGPWVGNYGDPIVLYDEIADRWLLTQFSLPNYPYGPYYILLAISATNDPTGSYHLYAYSFDDLPDYPKFGIWPDGYYMSINKFSSGSLYWAGAGVAAFKRSEMLNGNSAEMVYFSFISAQDPMSFLPADFDGTAPPANTPNYFTYIDHWSGTDRLRLYEFDVDWTNTSNSTFTGPFDINVAPFINNPGSIPQLGGQTLDNLTGRLMFRLQYRNFGTYQTLVTNHTVDAGSGRAGVRWYELRNTGTGWSMHQQGTYAPLDGHERWMGSVAMNANGDIALGYSVSSSTMHPAIRYTGRSASDPLGQMLQPEQTIHTGTASQSGTNRWGDYSAMAVDPSDNTTFWYTQEYSSGGLNWKTRIASFSFAPPVLTANFIGNPTAIVAGETVTFTDMSLASPTSWSWEFPGGNPNVYVGQNPPPITYNFAGNFNVTLTVSDGVDTHCDTKVNYIHVANCAYCYSAANNASEEWVSNFTFNTINNSANTFAGYEDFTYLSTEVIQGNTYNVSVSCGSIGSWPEHYWIFIDWNQNCDLTDPGDSYDLGQTSGPGTLSQNIIIPDDAVPGSTRMRVIVRYNSDATSCGTPNYGQVEDYTLKVLSTDLTLDLRAMLEGPFNGTDMDAKLGTLIPLYQPFNIAPWNYTGTDYVGAVPDGNIVEWVLVDLRDASTAFNATGSATIAKQAAFILNDGSIVDLDGSSYLQFPVSINQNLYVVVWQRNHLGIMSNNALTPSEGVYSYDFTSGINQVYGGANGHKQLSSGIWGMISGDGDHNGLIGDGDKSSSWDSQAGTKGYIYSDYNLDSESNNIDKDEYWVPNIGSGTQVPN